MGSLRTPNAKFLGTTNPDTPSNFVKTDYLDRIDTLDLYNPKFMMGDNPSLTKQYVEEVSNEYLGVLNDRFIKGLWVRAEGVIYGAFADKPERYLVGTVPALNKIIIGVDFGGNKSGHSFTASGITKGYGKLVALASQKHPATGTKPEDIYHMYREFEEYVVKNYGRPQGVYVDSAEQVLLNGLRDHTDVPVYNSHKPKIIDRVRKLNLLMGSGRFAMTTDCKSLQDALCDAVWNAKSMEDERLDDGTSDIDSIDSFEYSWTWYMDYF